MSTCPLTLPPPLNRDSGTRGDPPGDYAVRPRATCTCVPPPAGPVSDHLTTVTVDPEGSASSGCSRVADSHSNSMQEMPPIRRWGTPERSDFAGWTLSVTKCRQAMGRQQQPRCTPAGVCRAPPHASVCTACGVPAALGDGLPQPRQAVHVRCRPAAVAWDAGTAVQEWLLHKPPSWGSQLSVLRQGQAQAARGQPPRMTHGPPPPALTQRGGRRQAGGRPEGEHGAGCSCHRPHSRGEDQPSGCGHVPNAVTSVLLCHGEQATPPQGRTCPALSPELRTLQTTSFPH